MSAANAVDALLSELSCGNSCVVAKARGMATNGGCRCLDGLEPEKRRRVMQALRLYRHEVDELRRREKEHR